MVIMDGLRMKEGIARFGSIEQLLDLELHRVSHDGCQADMEEPGLSCKAMVKCNYERIPLRASDSQITVFTYVPVLGVVSDHQ